MLRLAILSGLLAIAAVTWGQEAVGPVGAVLTLEQAVALALQNNRQVQNAALEVGKKIDQAAAARTSRLPAFNLYFLESYLLSPIEFTFPQGSIGTFPSTGPIPATDKTIRTERQLATFVATQATQPLSQLYRLGLNVQLQEVGGAVAQEELRQQRQAVVYDVKQVYYGIFQTLSSIAALNVTLQSYRELDRLVTDYVRQHKALKVDSLEVKTRLAKAEYDLLTLRHTLDTQQEQLNNLMGIDIGTALRVAPVPDPVSDALDQTAASARALAQRPELKAAQLKVQQAEYNRRIKLAEYIPDLSLAFTYVSAVNVELVPKNISSVGLLLTWDVFDWGRKKHQVAERSKTVAQARTTVSDTENTIRIEVRSRLRTVQEKAALIQVNQLARETAREKVRLALDKYTQQAALLQDVLQAQANLADADATYQAGLLALWTARADLEKALGEEY
jgi:outer membrane protein